jgi:NADH-quinone oxidoreductase subunit A
VKFFTMWGPIMDEQISSFFPVLLFLAVVGGFAVAAMTATHIFPKPRKKTPAKDMPYESGMDPEGDARQHFDVKFYLVAILFLIFDVELLFLYPWATAAYPPTGVSRTASYLPAGLSNPVFIVMLLFNATLILAYVYAWKKGVFTWR